MEAVTSPEYARIEETVNGEKIERDFLVEPLTNYFVGRINQDVLEGNSVVGLMMTTVNRQDSKLRLCWCG